MKTRYLKLWFKPQVSANGSPVKSGLYAITSETCHMLAGRKIDKYGTDDSSLDETGTILDRVHVILKSTIRRRQTWAWNMHYGELEPVRARGERTGE